MSINLQDVLHKINQTQEKIERVYMKAVESGLNEEETNAATLVLETMCCMADFLEQKITGDN